MSVETIRVSDPATGAALGEIPDMPAAAVAAAVARARAAQPAWAALGFRERAARLRRLVRRLRDDPSIVDTLVAESGKPRHEAELIELFYLCELTRFYSGRAGRRALRDDLRSPFVFRNKRARVVYHPRGVVGIIGPWNWPILNNFADAIAPLLAGNAVVLKPSEWTPLTSLKIRDAWQAEGLPGDLMQVVTGRGPTGAALVERADMIFFTGSQAVGRQIARMCGERLIPVVLELGGKSPMIVAADADLPRAAHAAVWSGFAHSGQVCIRTERVMVEESAVERFTALCVDEVKMLRQGLADRSPAAAGDERIDVGAITFPGQIEVAERQIADAVGKGARVVAGGKRRADLPGRFFEPTVLAGATIDMEVMNDETFGPVLPIMKVTSAEAAVDIANASPFGLSGSVWSGDIARAKALARRLESGSVCVNDVLVNYFVVEAPLGGVKASGVGFRHGAEALHQFCRIETVVEDAPLLGLLSPAISKWLAFPYRPSILRLVRWCMSKIY